MLKVLPVKKLGSRVVMANILSFVDYGPAVLNMMQCISKTTRAYIYNADALKGYLLPEPPKIMDILDSISDKWSDKWKSEKIVVKTFHNNHYMDWP